MVEQIEDGATAPATEEPVVFEVRVILPTEAGTVVQAILQSTDVLDPVRALLQETRESCHLTNYSLEMRGKDGSVVNLSDFVEVGIYVPQQDPAVEQGTLELRVVQNDYDLRKAKEHVKRFRDIVMFPQHLSSSSSSDKDKGEQEKEQEEEKKATEVSDDVPLPKAEDLAAPLDLSKFYFETLTRLARVDPTLAPPPVGTAGALAAAMTVAAAQPSSARLPSDSIKAISYSGWSPPPSHRRAAGDLLYLDVFTVDSGILQITASPAGFFVNASTRSSFDPAPAAKPCFAPTLLECLQLASPAFRLAWAALCEAPKEEQQRPHAHPFDSIATSLAQGRPEVLGKQWCAVPPSLLSSSSTSLNKAHRFDAYRAQSCSAPVDLEDEDLLRGLQREWNEDVHSCRGEPETYMKARILFKTYADFAQTAQVGAEAVVDGLIQPFNPNERPEMQVFVFNGIYFSSPSENRELRLSSSPDAARKIAGHDLKNMRHLQTLFSNSLSTVLHAVVDYKGRRLVAQTAVPGVLSPQGGVPSSSARLMFGCLASGERISVSTRPTPSLLSPFPLPLLSYSFWQRADISSTKAQNGAHAVACSRRAPQTLAARVKTAAQGGLVGGKRGPGPAPNPVWRGTRKRTPLAIFSILAPLPLGSYPLPSLPTTHAPLINPKPVQEGNSRPAQHALHQGLSSAALRARHAHSAAAPAAAQARLPAPGLDAGRYGR